MLKMRKAISSIILGILIPVLSAASNNGFFSRKGVFVQNPISDRHFQFGAATEKIDISGTFMSAESADPVIESVVSNSDPSVAYASISGDTLSIKISSYNSGLVTIKIRGTDQNSAYAEDEFYIYVHNPADVSVEDFNDGNFTAPSHTWSLTNSGGEASNWFIADSSPQEGAYCACTDSALTDNQWCAITASVNYSAPGMISFWKKLSTEENNDLLNFYIDGVKVADFSGITDWTKSEFIVSAAGYHSFKFEYNKNGSVSSGLDQVYLDYIEFYNTATDITPPAPLLIGTSVADWGYIRFDWQDVTSATMYNIIVDDNSDFSSPVVNTSVTESQCISSFGFGSGVTYYWKVKVTSDTGPFSDIKSFNNIFLERFPIISLFSGNIRLNWDDIADATNYDVYASPNPFGTFSVIANVTVSEYTYVPTAPKMFFYVVAKNNSK